MKTVITLEIETPEHFCEEQVRSAVDDMLRIGQSDAHETIEDLPNESHPPNTECANSMEWTLVKTHQPTPPNK